MADVYLRSVPSDANTADVRLYDPTTADTVEGGEEGVPGQYFESYYRSPRPVGSYRIKSGFFWKVV